MFSSRHRMKMGCDKNQLKNGMDNTFRSEIAYRNSCHAGCSLKVWRMKLGGEGIQVYQLVHCCSSSLRHAGGPRHRGRLAYASSCPRSGPPPRGCSPPNGEAFLRRSAYMDCNNPQMTAAALLTARAKFEIELTRWSRKYDLCLSNQHKFESG